MKTRKHYHKQDQRRNKGIPARIEAICKREVLQRCKTSSDPMEQLARTGRLHGRKVG